MWRFTPLGPRGEAIRCPSDPVLGMAPRQARSIPNRSCGHFFSKREPEVGDVRILLGKQRALGITVGLGGVVEGCTPIP